MKTKPSTEYALLGALMTGPKHGYEIMQFIETAMGSTWYVGTSQVYLLLKKLEQDGLLCSSMETQGTRPPKRVFSLRKAGKKSFLDWLHSPTEHVRDLRIEFLAKLFFFNRLSLKGGRPIDKGPDSGPGTDQGKDPTKTRKRRGPLQQVGLRIQNSHCYGLA